MTLRTAAYRVSAAFRDLRDRGLYPEAEGAADQWQRVAMNRAADRRIASLDPSQCTAAEISGDNHAGRPWKGYTSLNYPEFDLCEPLSEAGTYDVVICEQVLEHVVEPIAAVDNLRRLCAPGGQAIVSTPFLIKVHELPEYGMLDYWRFTPRGLRLLLERAGLVVEEMGAWGNRQCVAGNLRVWSAYRPWHSLHNEADVPVQIWAFARNPES